MRQYASLIGPLLNLYFPLPFKDEELNRVALNTSKLKLLWCAVYTEKQVDEIIGRYGGIKLPNSFSDKLDYNSYEINLARNEMAMSKE